MILAKLYRNDTALILIAIALGLLLGILRPELAVQLKPLSDAFLGVIGHAVPLVMFVLVASAVSAFGERGQHTRCAGRVVVYFLMMAVFGLIAAMLINMFIASSFMSFLISIAGVLIFAGLTAFDTQRLKFQYYELGGDTRSMSVATTYGALSLYINFINMFQFILALMSGRE